MRRRRRAIAPPMPKPLDRARFALRLMWMVGVSGKSACAKAIRNEEQKMKSHMKTSAIKATTAAGRSMMNDRVEAASLLAGDPNDGNPANLGVAFIWGHDADPDSNAAFTSLVLRADAAAVMLQFGLTDIDDGPTQIVVAFVDLPGHMLTYSHGSFWMADDDDTLLIVFEHMDRVHGHFAIRGGRLDHRADWPAQDLTVGIERAKTRLQTTVAKLRLQKGGSGTTMHEVRFTG